MPARAPRAVRRARPSRRSSAATAPWRGGRGAPPMRGRILRATAFDARHIDLKEFAEIMYTDLAARALVTGGARNIGPRQSRRRSSPLAGATVVLNARTSLDAAQAGVADIEAQGGKALAHLADVTDEQLWSPCYHEWLTRFSAPRHPRNNSAVRTSTKSGRHRPLPPLALRDRHHPRRRFICHEGGATDANARATGRAIVNPAAMSCHTVPRAGPTCFARAGLVASARALHYPGRVPWLITVTAWCPASIDTQRCASSAEELAFARRFLGMHGQARESPRGPHAVGPTVPLQKRSRARSGP